MPTSLVVASIYATAVCVVAAAVAQDFAWADDAAPQPPAPPTVASKVRVFVIPPEESDQKFMCESGRVQSVLAHAIAEHRIVSIVFLDQSGEPIPEGAWASAYGFRLLHRQSIKVEAAMICGD